MGVANQAGQMIMILVMRYPAFRTPARLVAVAVAAALLTVLAACGGDDGGAATGRPTVVVTTSPLGALVRDLVGDTADVEVLIPNDLDPHDFQPSVKDAERLARADLIVSNGAELETGLEGAIAQARRDGVPTFVMAAHVPLRSGPESGHDGEEGHEHGASDPHIWLDPVLMARGMAALAPVIEAKLSVDLRDRPAQQRARLAELNARLQKAAAQIPAARRKLVTGHDSLGYFARRYGFEVVGAVIPSLSSQAEPSAAQVGGVVATIRREKVPAIFSETGTPRAVAEAISSDSGAKVVDLTTHSVADDGSYYTTMENLMTTIADNLRDGG